MTLTYETVDVFTRTAFGGNPLAVVFGGEALGVETMQAICPPHPDYSSVKAITEQDVADFNEVIHFAEHNINSIMGRMMRALEGKVVII